MAKLLKPSPESDNCRNLLLNEERNLNADSNSGSGKPHVAEASVHRPAMPAPTLWPVTLALGSSFLVWGTITSWIISGVGLVLFAVALGGWIRELRHERES
jgi:hypothetical protein